MDMADAPPATPIKVVVPQPKTPSSARPSSKLGRPLSLSFIPELPTIEPPSAEDRLCGLTADQAAAELANFGYNELRAPVVITTSEPANDVVLLASALILRPAALLLALCSILAIISGEGLLASLALAILAFPIFIAATVARRSPRSHGTSFVKKQQSIV